jgi:hypothetical protein
MRPEQDAPAHPPQFEWKARSLRRASDRACPEAVAPRPNSPGLSLGDTEMEDAAIALEDMAIGRATYTPLGLNTDVPLVGSAQELAPQVRSPALAELLVSLTIS